MGHEVLEAIAGGPGREAPAAEQGGAGGRQLLHQGAEHLLLVVHVGFRHLPVGAQGAEQIVVPLGQGHRHQALGLLLLAVLLQKAHGEGGVGTGFVPVVEQIDAATAGALQALLHGGVHGGRRAVVPPGFGELRQLAPVGQRREHMLQVVAQHLVVAAHEGRPHHLGLVHHRALVHYRPPDRNVLELYGAPAGLEGALLA